MILVFLVFLALLLRGAAAKQLAAGYGHFCHVQSNGQAYCHGWNLFGALGDGTNISRPFPTQILGIGPVGDLCAGGAHTCVVQSSDGSVMCTGYNLNGVLGDGTELTRAHMESIIVSNEEQDVFDQVECGFFQTCALLKQGNGIKCWGGNVRGELGVDSHEPRYSPTSPVMENVPDVVSIATGVFHTCLATAEGAAFCTGSNAQGQLGSEGEDSLVFRPVRFPGGENEVVSIHAGFEHTCALTALGAVWCWGGNSLGALGNNKLGGHSSLPVRVEGLEQFVDFVSCGYFNTFVVQNGIPLAFGDNGFAQLGLAAGNYSLVPKPTFTDLQQDVLEIRSGYRATCVLSTRAGLQCIGRDVYGQLGNGLPLADSAVLTSTIVAVPPREEDGVVRNAQCRAAPAQSRLQCAIKTRLCKRLGIPMQWVGKGCQNDGKRVRDAGCQCQPYCGFTCKTQCNRNKRYCTWDSQKQVCTPLPTTAAMTANKEGYCQPH